MIEKMSNYILDNFLYKDEKVEGNEREIMLFGITRILEDIPKYTIIFLIGYFCNILQYMGIVLAITMMYKTFVGGVHARTNIACLIFSTIYFILPVFIAKYINVNIYLLTLVTFLLSLIVIWRIAPADTEEIPILKKAKRKKLKLIGLISLLVILSFNLLEIQDLYIQNIILITILNIDLCTTKLVYKFFKCKYSYESEEFKEYYNK
ncbi:MAG: accessory gene regulator B family protein [Clostridia bacterium]|nr:accessory gene regulator B family protein [Clostridia bacterium]